LRLKSSPAPAATNRDAEGDMIRQKAIGAALVLLSTTVAAAQPTDLQILKSVAAKVDGDTQVTIFDDVNATVNDGVVTLTGKVTMPYKRADLERRVAAVAGVRSVADRIAVLPVSSFDDELRYRIARAIYGHSNFWNYAIMPNPPIHIVVENGRVTLTGVVTSDVDRVLARSLATQFGALSVTNDLKTDAEVQALRETQSE
jgi:osmotically-inducible protein OsmY